MPAALHPSPSVSRTQLLWLAVALSMGAAISLGITRFSYALLLPPMREDLGWSYTLAGGMNTANALGYLLGALVTPLLLRRLTPGALLVVGCGDGHGVHGPERVFYTRQRPSWCSGCWRVVASALGVHCTGGCWRRGWARSVPGRSGLLLGLYYGGTGWGISVSALLVPAVLAMAARSRHGWTWAWWALAAGVWRWPPCCCVWPARVMDSQASAAIQPTSTTPPAAGAAPPALPQALRKGTRGRLLCPPRLRGCHGARLAPALAGLWPCLAWAISAT
jgi:hypothetical protein